MEAGQRKASEVLYLKTFYFQARQLCKPCPCLPCLFMTLLFCVQTVLHFSSPPTKSHLLISTSTIPLPRVIVRSCTSQNLGTLEAELGFVLGRDMSLEDAAAIKGGDLDRIWDITDTVHLVIEACALRCGTPFKWSEVEGEERRRRKIQRFYHRLSTAPAPLPRYPSVPLSRCRPASIACSAPLSLSVGHLYIKFNHFWHAHNVWHEKGVVVIYCVHSLLT